MQQFDTIDIPVEYRRVGFGRRFIAFLIDLLILIVLSLAVGFALYTLGVSISMLNDEDVSLATWIYQISGMSKSDVGDVLAIAGTVSFAGVVIGVLYSFVELFFGTSPGKLALGLVIAHSDGSRADIRLWGKRWLLKNLNNNLSILALIPTLSMLGIIGTIIGLLFFLGCLFALSDSRLALHDRIVQTAVFHKGDLT